MGLKEVQAEIISNAKKEAESILNKAKKEKKELLLAAQKQVAQKQDDYDQQAKETVSQYKTVTLAKAHSLAKKNKLKLRKELVEEAFTKAKDELNNLPANKREAHVRTILEHANFSYEKILLNEKDLGYAQAEKADIAGGAILLNQEGDIRVDMSYDTLLDEVKRSQIPKIVEVLFRGG